MCIRDRGGDYTIEEIAGGSCVQNNGGEVIILSFKDNCSTTAIVKRIQAEEATD